MPLAPIIISIMNYFGDNPQFFLGNFVYKSGGRLGPRQQFNLQLVYVFSGHANIWIDGQHRYIGPGQVTLLLPGHEERFEFSQTTSTRHGWCEVLRAQLHPDLARAYEQLPASLPFTQRMRQLDRIGRGAQDDPRVSMRRLHAAVAQAVFFEFLQEAHFQDVPAIPLPQPLLRAREYIERNFAQPCDLARLARIAQVTPAHLIRLFKRHLNTTPIDFLWHTRVQAGARLLVETGLSVHELSRRVGFVSQYHFSRLVKKRLGKAPRQYRRDSWAS